MPYAGLSYRTFKVFKDDSTHILSEALKKVSRSGFSIKDLTILIRSISKLRSKSSLGQFINYVGIILRIIDSLNPTRWQVYYIHTKLPQYHWHLATPSPLLFNVVYERPLATGQHPHIDLAWNSISLVRDCFICPAFPNEIWHVGMQKVWSFITWEALINRNFWQFPIWMS